MKQFDHSKENFVEACGVTQEEAMILANFLQGVHNDDGPLSKKVEKIVEKYKHDPIMLAFAALTYGRETAKHRKEHTSGWDALKK